PPSAPSPPMQPPAAPTARPEPAAPARPRPSQPAAAHSRPEPRPRAPRRLVRSARLPSLDLLAPASPLPDAEAEIRFQAQVLEETLAQFGVPARVVDVRRGPTVTQYGVEPGFMERKMASGATIRRKVRVGRIAALASDLALALAVPAVRIEAPVPGRSLVGIEVPNRQSTLVNLRSVIESEAYQRIRSPLRVALGQDVSGNPVAADLAAMPHLLIAGATGTGKSVCLHSLIACLLLENTPETLNLVLVDPKRVEMSLFSGMPHLAGPVIVEVPQVVAALRWLCQEMDRRYSLFAAHRVRHIEGLNAVAGRRQSERLPYIVLCIDELADLMLAAPDEVERSICRLAQMGRATGIHLVVATQRPSVDVVTGLIKANFPARIAFAVSSQVDSRVILDSAGAEQLLGRGDMLYMAPDASHLLRLQGCFTSDAELAAIADHWRQSVEPTQDGEPELAPWEGLAGDAEDSDVLVEQALALAREHRQLSASLLQRRLRIGYPRAARLIEELEARGIVGADPGGGRPREVLSPAHGDLTDEEGA
ncbi:MAG: DNA translocase FtsK, partial [Anaerolineae bacterium]|nr:DNA translocase FtsK [Anaerolineae bacterium]